MRYAVVLGAADCMLHDVQRIAQWGYTMRPTIIAVNDAGWVWPDALDHWVSLHGEHFPGWQRKRLDSGASMSYDTWTRPKDDGVKTTHRLGHWGVGSSGLYAITVAFHLGIDRVVLCGVPMEARPHIANHEKYGADDWPQSEVDIHRPGWEHHIDKLEGRVKSVSGWTRDLLGYPEMDWLYSEGP